MTKKIKSILEKSNLEKSNEDNNQVNIDYSSPELNTDDNLLFKLSLLGLLTLCDNRCLYLGTKERIIKNIIKQKNLTIKQKELILSFLPKTLQGREKIYIDIKKILTKY